LTLPKNIGNEGGHLPIEAKVFSEDADRWYVSKGEQAMKKTAYYLTFGQTSPARNGFVLIYARDHDEARAIAIETYGSAWSRVYHWGEFDGSRLPAGNLDTLGREDT